jgi:iron complex transport system ATP-binding protein
MTVRVEATSLSLPGRLQPVSLNVEAGQLVCLVGPNGSGKTSLLHALARIGAPQGRVLIDGRDPERLGPSQRQQLLTYLPAGRDTRWPIHVRDLVRLGVRNDAKVDWVIDALELTPLLDRPADRLSTGERSRAMIARALAPMPRLMLLDEPTANLDPLWQLKIMELLTRLSRDNDVTVLLAMHDLSLAARYADRLIVMQEGRIAGDGAPGDLLASEVIPTVFGIRRAGDLWIAA